MKNIKRILLIISFLSASFAFATGSTETIEDIQKKIAKVGEISEKYKQKMKPIQEKMAFFHKKYLEMLKKKDVKSQEIVVKVLNVLTKKIDKLKEEQEKELDELKNSFKK